MILKQATASQSVLIGPFVDEDDGKTAEAGLTINNTDIRVSKNGGNMVDKNSGGGTHDEAGWYTITLDATDTSAVGRLQISVHVSGALPVWMEFDIVEEDTYNFLYASGAAPDTQVAAIDTTTMRGTDSVDTATMRGTDDAALASIATEGRLAELDAGNLPTDIADVKSETVLIVEDTNELQLDNVPGLISTLDGDVATDIAAVKTETALIVEDTNELQLDDIPGKISTLDTDVAADIAALNNAPAVSAAQNADAVWNEAAAGHTDAGKAGEQLWTDLDAVLADSDELQQDDVPGLIAALNDPTAAAIAAQVFSEVVENSLTYKAMVRIMYAVLAGKSTGGGGSSLTFRDSADSKPRVSATVDSNGNRTGMTLDGS